MTTRPIQTIVDRIQTPPPPGGRGGGGSGANNNSGHDTNVNSGKGSGFTMPKMPCFMTNNFNGGFGYDKGDPNNKRILFLMKKSQIPNIEIMDGS